MLSSATAARLLVRALGDLSGHPLALATVNPLHAAADSHVAKLSVALRYAFAKGRKAVGRGDADAAAKAIRAALEDVLPKTLLGVLKSGGEAGVKLLIKRLRAAGDLPGHEFHGNQYTSMVLETDHYKAVGAIIEELTQKHGADWLRAYVKIHQAGKVPGMIRRKVAKVNPIHEYPDLMYARAAADSPLRMIFDASNKAAAAWARMHAATLAKDISDTSRDRIRRAVADLQEEGDFEGARDEIAAAVGDEDRANLIARHETMLAANEGQRQAWDQAVDVGLLTGDEVRSWIATPDEHICPICEELDGTTAPIGEDYEGGYDGPPAHVGCRCTEGIV